MKWRLHLYSQQLLYVRLPPFDLISIIQTPPISCRAHLKMPKNHRLGFVLCKLCMFWSVAIRSYFLGLSMYGCGMFHPPWLEIWICACFFADKILCAWFFADKALRSSLLQRLQGAILSPLCRGNLLKSRMRRSEPFSLEGWYQKAGLKSINYSWAKTRRGSMFLSDLGFFPIWTLFTKIVSSRDINNLVQSQTHQHFSLKWPDTKSTEISIQYL